MIFFEKGSFINFKNVASKVIQHLNPPDLCLKGTQPKERKQKNIARAPYWLNLLDHLRQVLRSCYNHHLGSRLLMVQVWSQCVVE